MPFVETPERNQSDLNAFYYDNIKNPIEKYTGFKNQYKVLRSEDTFDITTQIIFNIYDSDILICDLSGYQANPNVMYELGVRLALSNDPVILIREENEKNRKIFDIAGFHSFDYKITQYKKVEEYLINKILKFETGEEIFKSPVLKTLKRHPIVTIELSNREINSRMIALHREITFLKARFSDAVWTFLKDKVTEDQWLKIRDQKDNTNIMKALGEKILTIDWTGFNFQINHLPCISHFVSSYPLVDVIHNDCESEFSIFITDFYGNYLTSNSYWQNFKWDRFLKFTYDIDFLLNIILAIVGVINPEHYSQKEKFYTYLRQTLNSYAEYKKKQE